MNPQPPTSAVPVRIALIMDWDDTLCPDIISALVEKLEHDPMDYWNPLDELVKQGWDIVTAYMHGLVKLFDHSNEAESVMIEHAKQHPCFEGTYGLVARAKKHLYEHFGTSVVLESYIISSGLSTMIENHPLSKEFDHHWASSFHFDHGRIEFPKNILNFSDKLRCLEQIHRGKIHDGPLSVNELLAKEDRPIPYENMIFVGDGYTDIPCFSKVKSKGGQCLAVVPEYRGKSTPLSEQLWKEQRVHAIAPARYEESSEAWDWITKAMSRVANKTLQ